MNQPVTREDLQRAVDHITMMFAEYREDIRIDFRDVKERQDRTNGRIDGLEDRERDRESLLRDHGQTMAGVVATMKSLADARTATNDDHKPGISARDVKVAMFMFGVGGALISYGPKIVKALMAIGSTP